MRQCLSEIPHQTWLVLPRVIEIRYQPLQASWEMEKEHWNILRLKCWSHKGSSFYWLKRGTSVACDPFLCGNRHLASNQWDTHIFGDKASFFGLDQTKPRIELIWVYSWCCWIWSPERVSPEHKMSCPSIFLRGRVASARWLKACSSDGWLRRINECHWHRWE